MLFRSLVGPGNTRIVQGSTIESSSFNAWAMDSRLVFIEEIKLHGHNRYDVTNTLKPLITNNTIEIHPKNRDPINVPNYAAYFITTNYKDGVPIEYGERRYFVIFSRFPLVRIQRDEPEYFDILIEAVRQQAGAIGHWLLSVPYHEDFKPFGHAPWSVDKDEARFLTTDDMKEAIGEILEDSLNPAFGPEVVLHQPFLDYLTGQGSDVSSITGYHLNRTLMDLGFKKLGRRRVLDGDRYRVWARCEDDEPTLDWAKDVIDVRVTNSLL